MDIKYHEKNFHISDKLRAVVEKKLEKITKYFGDDATCTAVLSKIAGIERMELTIVASGHSFRAQEESRSMYECVDNALAKIERQVVKNRSKLRTIIRHNNINAKKYEFLAAKEAAKIVEMAEVRKNKAFPVVALSDQDAEVALSTLDHDFYIYADPKTNGVKVMYRRDDGHVGVIDVMNAAIKPFKK